MLASEGIDVMIENLETLLTLARTGTMMEASTELRISQSAVSKRISTLERYYDRKLIQKKGEASRAHATWATACRQDFAVLSRNCVICLSDEVAAKGELIIGVSDAILSSWGPECFMQFKNRCRM